LDTNIVVSALLFGQGRLAPIRLAWQHRIFTPLISTETAEELVRVLNYPKFKLSGPERNELLSDYLPNCAVVTIPPKRLKVPHCRDPADLPFLQLATYGKAGYLVSGNHDLLELRDATPYAIVTPEAFMAKLELS
jgi:uncharacterized protein